MLQSLLQVCFACTLYKKHVLTAIGRVQAVRTAGGKLVFFDLKQGNTTLQIICQLNTVDATVATKVIDFKSFVSMVRKGDWYEVRGWPTRSEKGQFSMLASQIPKLLAPTLHQIPATLEDPETRVRNRHLDMLVNDEAVLAIRMRHVVEHHLNDFFHKGGFTKVSTPILSAGAGGAIARPFETEATELEGQKLNLRIAPELWLKRLIVGGLDRVYEIGPVFRNEGVDATHNPEFHTCEFYEAFATLEDLMARTETLLHSMSRGVRSYFKDRASEQAAPGIFQSPFRKVEFIPAIERILQAPLPKLSEPDAADAIINLFRNHNLTLPSNATLPRLLDALSTQCIEPLCDKPTFITHHPAVLSPLAKHTTCTKTGQIISMRAELFIQGREYANMYEEENSPFAQRQKFEDQLKFRAVDGESDQKGGLDEQYLETLEWGLPPTGGWGCGIDRLVMLFAGRERISDVLPFGTLRNVVGLSKQKVNVRGDIHAMMSME